MDLYFVSVRKNAKKNLSNIQPIPYFLEQAPGRLFEILAEMGALIKFSF